MSFPRNWSALEEWLRQQYKCSAVLLYGSSASGNLLPGSDIDLLCIAPEPRLRMVQASFGDTVLDIALGSPECLDRAMLADARGNSNFVLQALVTGKIRCDSEGDLARLIDRAQIRWQCLPAPPGTRERAIIRARCLKISGTANRLRAIHGASPAMARLADTQSAIFLGMLVEDYCRVRQLWASSLRQLLQTGTPPYLDLQTFLKAYMEAPPADSRLDMIARFSTQLFHAAQETAERVAQLS